ncbi:MAG: ATP synthase gamma chain, partial [uncultured Solirubrobacterales bacterium]
MPAGNDIKDRIESVKNVKQITRAMEMVAAARLRKAEQRIEALRPYADALRRMTRRAVEAAERLPDLPLLEEHDSIDRVGLLLVTGDRGLAGAFNSQIIRAGERRARELQREGQEAAWYVIGAKGGSSLTFRGYDVEGTYTGFTDRPAYANAREVGQDMISAYTDGKIDRAELFYNGYISPMSQVVRHETLMPLQQADFYGESEEDGEDGEASSERENRDSGDDGDSPDHSRALWIYEPEPGEILRQLAPDYVEISIYRAMLESTASEHGARMTAMRSASDNASEMIDDLTMQANRERQAQITQE